MKKNWTLFLLLVFTSLSYGQEICNNAIDDDGDSLIDINDADCQCNETNIPSLIPNPSFELYTECPISFSELHLAQNWIQSTNATTDYFNCDYAFPAFGEANLTNYPDGTAIVGALYLQNWKEYVGCTLASPLQAGTTYRLTFKIAAMLMTVKCNLSTALLANLDPVNVTLFGCVDGTNLPVNTEGSPDAFDNTWFEIGHVTYTPLSQWGDITIEFTPTTNINAIMIGPPNILPATYPNNQEIDALPYFVYDQLTLNKLNYFEINLYSTGSFCTNNVVLHLQNPLSGYDYQWYTNGVAIPNATGETLSISSYVPGVAYSVRGVNDVYCFVSEAINLQTIVPDPPGVNPISYCQNAIANPLSVSGNNLLWYASAFGGTGSPIAPTPPTNIPGDFIYYVSQTCGIESERAQIIVTIIPLQEPNFAAIEPLCYGTEPPTLSPISPNSIAGFWSPSSIDTFQSAHYLFTPNTSQCGTTQTLYIEITDPVNFTITGDCNNEFYLLEAKSIAVGFDHFNFQWNDNGNPIGTNSPILNVTSIVGHTFETDYFPHTYGLVVSDGNGCGTYLDFLVEKIFCSIPKGISPNGDGLNDFFDLSGLHVTLMEIFNRYGVSVYRKENYTTEWNGQTDEGKELPDATYFYYLTFEKEKPQTGWVYLNR